jgi:hypothetical protein
MLIVGAGALRISLADLEKPPERLQVPEMEVCALRRIDAKVPTIDLRVGSLIV